jgi:hypothetical protein
MLIPARRLAQSLYSQGTDKNQWVVFVLIFVIFTFLFLNIAVIIMLSRG